MSLHLMIILVLKWMKGERSMLLNIVLMKKKLKKLLNRQN